jgi:hypothetical protein
MDIGERAAAAAADERAEVIARRTAELLRDLYAVERRIDRLEALLRPHADCANLLPV